MQFKDWTWKNFIAMTAVCATFLVHANTHAMTVQNYKKLRELSAPSTGHTSLRLYVHGLQDGLEWSNATFRSQGKGATYCAPKNLALNTENYIQFIDEALSALREKPLAEDFPVSPILLQWLQKKFPC